MVFSTLSPMLKYTEMRQPLLLGLITSIGSKNKDIVGVTELPCSNRLPIMLTFPNRRQLLADPS